MNIMAGCIKCGSEITVECSGADENEMLKKPKSLSHRASAKNNIAAA